MSGRAIALEARAKLNLALRVGPVRPDGYHPVESLMVELSAPADRLTVAPAPRRAVICPGVPERDNLASRALDALAEATGARLALEVRITKEIPAGAGLGGGSSDAAATLLAAREVAGLSVSDAELERIGATVGSDVPFFIRGGAQWARGRGELLEVAPAPAFHALVCFQGPPLSTASVYARFDEIGAAAGPLAGPPPLDDPAAVGRWAQNDLWPAARDLRPDLANLAKALEDAGAVAPLLCGSGAAVCGLFADPQAAASAAERVSRQAAVWPAGPARR